MTESVSRDWRAGDRIPVLPLQPEEPAIEIAAIPGLAQHAGVLGAELHQLRRARAGNLEQQSVVACEGLVAIPGNRYPVAGLGVLEAGPAPLVRVPVPVADEHIRQTRGQNAARPPDRWDSPPPPSEACRADDLVRPREAGGAAASSRPLLDGAEHAAVLGGELSQPRMIPGRRPVAWPWRIPAASRTGGARSAPTGWAALVWSRTMPAAAVARSGGRTPDRILVERAELYSFPSAPLRRRDLVCSPPPFLVALSPPAKLSRSSTGDLDRGGPEIPIVAAK